MLIIITYSIRKRAALEQNQERTKAEPGATLVLRKHKISAAQKKIIKSTKTKLNQLKLN